MLLPGHGGSGIQEGQAGPASARQKAESNSQVDWLSNVLWIFLACSSCMSCKHVLNRLEQSMWDRLRYISFSSCVYFVQYMP